MNEAHVRKVVVVYTSEVIVDLLSEVGCELQDFTFPVGKRNYSRLGLALQGLTPVTLREDWTLSRVNGVSRVRNELGALKIGIPEKCSVDAARRVCSSLNGIFSYSVPVPSPAKKALEKVGSDVGKLVPFLERDYSLCPWIDSGREPFLSLMREAWDYNDEDHLWGIASAMSQANQSLSDVLCQANLVDGPLSLALERLEQGYNR